MGDHRKAFTDAEWDSMWAEYEGGIALRELMTTHHCSQQTITDGFERFGHKVRNGNKRERAAPLFTYSEVSAVTYVLNGGSLKVAASLYRLTQGAIKVAKARYRLFGGFIGDTVGS